MISFNEVDKKIIEYAVSKRKNIFIHGPAGVGKSTLIKEIVKRSTNRVIAVTATTGIAALNIGGTTLHRFAGIFTGIGTAEELWEVISKKYLIKRQWKNTNTLIIDEVSMLGGELFDKLNFIAQKARNSTLPFGGMQLILTGDLFQLPPIKDTWIFNSETWKTMNFEFFNLTEPKRYSEASYYNILLQVRKGELTQESIELFQERHAEFLKVKDDIKNWEIQPTILYSRRENVERYNLEKLNNIDAEEWEFDAQDDFVSKKDAVFSEAQKKFYTSLLDEFMPKKIVLKVGAQVMLKSNINVEAGLVNGSRGVVLNITEDVILVKFLGNRIFPVQAVCCDYRDKYGLASRSQIPLILAWSCTIHKSQGTTIDFAIADVGEDIFANGQAYVALSRIRNVKGLFLSNFEPSAIKTDKQVLEFVKNFE